MSRRHKRIALLLALAALPAAAAALWFLMPARLSPEEQSLVGGWRLTNEIGAFALELSPDRTFQFRRLDGQEIGPGLYSLDGKWHVAGGVLVLDRRIHRRALLPVEVVAAGPGPLGIPLPGLRRLRPEQSEFQVERGDQLSLRSLHGTAVWKRVAEPGGPPSGVAPDHGGS